MKIRTGRRGSLAIVLSASSFLVILDGCTASKKLSNPEPTVAEVKAKKEYNWQDMSTGKSFFRPISPTPQE